MLHHPPRQLQLKRNCVVGPRLRSPTPVCSAHGGKRRARRARSSSKDEPPPPPPAEEAGEGLEVTVIADGQPLPTNVVDFSQSGSRPVRLVCISDTHGFEESLTNTTAAAGAKASTLPEGDVLIHCGDFAPGPIYPEGRRLSAETYQERFDAWLAAQPHPLKVVVRGNHDPRYAAFPLSGAVYATSPRTLELDVNGATLRLACAARGSQPAAPPPLRC